VRIDLNHGNQRNRSVRTRRSAQRLCSPRAEDVSFQALLNRNRTAMWWSTLLGTVGSLRLLKHFDPDPMRTSRRNQYALAISPWISRKLSLRLRLK